MLLHSILFEIEATIKSTRDDVWERMRLSRREMGGLRYKLQDGRRVEETVGNLEVWTGWFLVSTTLGPGVTQCRNNEVCNVLRVDAKVTKMHKHLCAG